jgi:hypothetical protein
MGTRELLTEAAKALRLEAQLRLVEPHRYQSILERIIAKRTTLHKDATSALWWWEALREPVAFAQPEDSLAVLRLLVSPAQPVWFVAEADGPKKNGNFWLYESTIEPICAVLQQLPPFEYYVVSKKCDWLICENHHGYLIANGEEMVAALVAAVPNPSIERTVVGKPPTAAHVER